MRRAAQDTTESDIKQRREIVVGGSAEYFDQAAVTAALHGRVLLIEGLEKVERNVLARAAHSFQCQGGGAVARGASPRPDRGGRGKCFRHDARRRGRADHARGPPDTTAPAPQVMPVLNNLLENREIALEDGRFMLPRARWEARRQPAPTHTAVARTAVPLRTNPQRRGARCAARLATLAGLHPRAAQGQPHGARAPGLPRDRAGRARAPLPGQPSRPAAAQPLPGAPRPLV